MTVTSVVLLGKPRFQNHKLLGKPRFQNHKQTVNKAASDSN